MSADPYDYAANLISRNTRDAIKAFWQHFAQNADALGRWFFNQQGGTQTVTDIMQPLREVSPNLMWEFGPATDGHMLTITAEFRDTMRPLARLMQRMAPNLPRWTFTDARPPSDPAQLAQEHLARFGFPLTLSQIEVSLGENGRINQHGYGAGRAVFDEVINVSTLLLGEEKERDWVGSVRETPSEISSPFAPLPWLDSFDAAIAEAQRQMPNAPHSALDPAQASGGLYQNFNLIEGDPRQDLITFFAPTAAYVSAALYGPLFSSRGFSRFNEWFMYLKIQRSPAAPFGHVEERAEVEDRLHATLSSAGIGGWVAAGNGTDHVYIDFAVTDVARAVTLLQNYFGHEVYAAGASLHVLDQGLRDITIPLTPPI
ncbi:MAG: hypothetical protein COB08_013205 [Rhodobacteraceae bacterium]|nr:hypothetical protein [Paracoccaceae bacterium]